MESPDLMHATLLAGIVVLMLLIVIGPRNGAV